MKLKICLTLCFLLVGSATFASNSNNVSTKILEQNNNNICLTTVETQTLVKLNSLSDTNKKIVLFLLDSFYDKKREIEKKGLPAPKQEDLDD